jgi:hypothetical protein
MLVAVFPLTIPSGAMAGAIKPLPKPKRVTVTDPVSTVQIAEIWNGADVALWSVRRQLMINSSAALVLLLSVTTIALSFRRYLAGRKLEQEIEIARTVQRDLLPSSQCEMADFEVSGDYTPLAQLGGDFYDTFAVRGDGAAFVLGDISGRDFRRPY